MARLAAKITPAKTIKTLPTVDIKRLEGALWSLWLWLELVLLLELVLVLVLVLDE